MSVWHSVEKSTPAHGQSVRTKGKDGRVFYCQYFHWSEDVKPYFKLVGKVWSHDNVTHWTPEPPQ